MATRRWRCAIKRYLSGQGDDRDGGAGGAGTPPGSRASVERYRRACEASGGDIRSHCAPAPCRAPVGCLTATGRRAWTNATARTPLTLDAPCCCPYIAATSCPTR